MDEQVWHDLERIAKQLGVKPKPYVQLVIGRHVQDMLGVMKNPEKKEESA